MRFNRALAEGRLPHKEVFDGVLIIIGGALLLTPGFLTDILGLILLIPPTRALVRAMSARWVRRRMAIGRRRPRSSPSARAREHAVARPRAGAGRRPATRTRRPLRLGGATAAPAAHRTAAR